LRNLGTLKGAQNLATPLARLEGKYEILEKIREGGMGAVYKVRHRLLEEVRVVKVMRPHLAEDEVLQARFLREAKVAIKLRHPNLAQIYDFTVDESGYAYLVMEFIDGLNLQEVIKVLERPGLGLVLEIARQSLEALGYLHRKRIIHRDVSPDNLLITRDDEGQLQVKLIDLGIAKVRGGDDSLTSEGTFLGKVRYSSPEHFKTQEGSSVKAASDLYSFGVVFYEMLTGAYPIKGTSVASLISGHLMHPPLDFDESDPDGLVPDELRAIVQKAIEKNPKKRYGSSASFTKALQPWIDKHPLEEEEFKAIFDMPTLTTHKIRTVKPGSTQSRIDRSFGLSTTPPPDAERDTEYETSGTIETDGTPARPDAKEDSKQAQIRALLVGAGKLAEAEHFDEARLQLASLLELDKENADALKLLGEVDAADVVFQQKRQDAADSVRLLIRAESFDQAATQLRKAVKELGQAGIFDTVSGELDSAKHAYEARIEKVNDTLKRAAELIENNGFDEAVPLLREGLDLEPGNRELIARLEQAEKGLEALLDARRRAKEIEGTAATIEGYIKQRDVDQAEHALKLAQKLYGAEQLFADLAAKLEELRKTILEEEVEALRIRAREEIEREDFSTALATLEEADGLAKGAEKTNQLFAAAREGIRLQEEAQKRQLAIDESALRIDRLITAGRLESAVHVVDTAIDELGEFEEASALRKKITAAKKSADATIKKADAMLEQALEHAGGESFAQASDFLDEVRALAAQHPQIGERVADAETEIHRRIESHRRQMAIDNVIQSVEGQLGKGALEEAQRELGVARRLYGESDVLDELGSTIETRQRERRKEEIAELLKNSRKSKKKHDQAIGDLEAALEIDPHNEDAHRLLVAIRWDQKRAHEKEVADQCESLIATIDELIADGDAAKALEVLETMVKDFGEFPLARNLRHALKRLLQQT
jgi:serine/threonine protein kinase